MSGLVIEIGFRRESAVEGCVVAPGGVMRSKQEEGVEAGVRKNLSM